MGLGDVVARGLLGLCIFPLVWLQAADLEPAADYEGKPVVEIRYEPPLQPILQSDLQRLMPLRDGTRLTAEAVRQTIKQLYSSGDYSDVEVDTEPAPNGVVVVIRTEEQWFVGPVEVRGKLHTPPNAGQLAGATRLQLGTAYEDSDVEGAIGKIRDLLQRNGLYLSKIEPKVGRDPEHQDVSLTFTVDSGKRARFTLPVVMGDTRLPPQQLAKAAKYKGWFFWKPATEENLQGGLDNIRKKYDKNERLTADVSLDHSDYLKEQNRVRPTIQADGGPKVKITSEGGKISKKNLQKYVPVFDEGTVNRDLLVEGVGNLRDYFQDAGYFDVQVDFQTAQPSPDQENITYQVHLGQRHKVVRIDIQGNHYFLTRDIHDRMFLQPAGLFFLRHGRYSEGFAKRDHDAIQALYQDNGFQDVKVTITTIDDYQGKTGDVAVTVAIQEGPQFKVGSLNVQGVDRPDRAQVLSKLASAPGEPFSATNVALDRDYLLRTYQSEGYPDVAFNWKRTAGSGPQTVNLTYTVTSGPKRYVREVLITGARTTRPRLIDPNILMKPGDPLSWTQMGDMQRRLYNLGVFDKVDMAIQNEQGDTENKYVLYHLTEGHRYYMAVGFGAQIARIGGPATSLSSPAGTTGFAPMGSFELSRLNLWGLGHSLNFKSNYSTLDRQISLNYLAPRFHNVDGRNISVTGLYDNETDVNTFSATRVEGDFQVSQKLSKPTTMLWRYTWRDVSVNQSTLKINPELIPLYAQSAHIGMLSANLIEDRRDDPTNAHRGIYNTVDLGLAESYFGGNKNFLHFLARNSYYKTIDTNLVLAFNTQFGWIHPFNVTPGVSGFDYIPIPERFFGGGSYTDRGFPDFQAGPRDLLTGFPLGGNALFFHTEELRFPLIGSNIGGVIFHDMGNVYTDLGSISFRTSQNNLKDFDYMVHAVGFGIRYRTPVGPIRLDLAYSVNPPSFFGLKGTYQQLLFGGATPQVQSISHFQFFFSIGQAF